MLIIQVIVLFKCSYIYKSIQVSKPKSTDLIVAEVVGKMPKDNRHYKILIKKY